MKLRSPTFKKILETHYNLLLKVNEIVHANEKVKELNEILQKNIDEFQVNKKEFYKRSGKYIAPSLPN